MKGTKVHRKDFDRWIAENDPKNNKPKWRNYSLAAIDPRPGFIYAIIDPATGQYRYIGKTANTSRRWMLHRSELRDGKHKNPYLQRWFNTLLPGTVIEFVELQKCEAGTMNDAEAKWIDRARASGAKLCNIAPAGIGAEKHSEETRRKLSEISKARWQTPEYKARHAAAVHNRHALKAKAKEESIHAQA